MNRSEERRVDKYCVLLEWERRNGSASGGNSINQSQTDIKKKNMMANGQTTWVWVKIRRGTGWEEGH